MNDLLMTQRFNTLEHRRKNVNQKEHMVVDNYTDGKSQIGPT